MIRNVLLTLLFLDGQLETSQASRDSLAEWIIHLWYSASIPGALQLRLQRRILPLIKHMRKETRNRVPAVMMFNRHTLRLDLTSNIWDQVERCCGQPVTSREEAYALRREYTNGPGEIDYHQQLLFKVPSPHVRVARQKFHEDGILLPFGDRGLDVWVPNP